MSTTYKLSNDAELFIKRFNCVITVGASGAVSSFNGDEVVAVTKETTDGQYTVELGDFNGEGTFVSVKDVNCILSGATLDDITPHVLTDALAASSEVVIQLHTAGTEANVTAANKIHLTITAYITGV